MIQHNIISYDMIWYNIFRGGAGLSRCGKLLPLLHVMLLCIAIHTISVVHFQDVEVNFRIFKHCLQDTYIEQLRGLLHESVAERFVDWTAITTYYYILLTTTRYVLFLLSITTPTLHETGVCEKYTPFMWTSALQSRDRNCSPAPDLALWRLICPVLLFYRGVFFSQTPVSYHEAIDGKPYTIT